MLGTSTRVLCMLLISSPLLAGTAKAATHYDIVNDFNVKANPNGVWTYMDTAPLPYHHHRLEGQPGLDVWSNDLSKTQTDLIARNKTGETLSLNHGRVAFPPGYLLIVAKDNPPGAIVQFRSPIAGTYVVKGSAMGLAAHGTHDHEFSIEHIDAQGEGELYRVHPSYMKAKTFHLHVSMSAGDTLLFEVGGYAGRRLDDVGVTAAIDGP